MKSGADRDASPQGEAVDDVNKDDVSQEEGRGVVDTADNAEAPIRPKRTAAEALQGLSDGIHRLTQRMDVVEDFVHVCKKRLMGHNEQYRSEGMLKGLEPLFNVHELLYKQLSALRDSEDVQPESFLPTLRGALEGELKSFGVQVIEPKQGKKANYALMKAIGHEPASLSRKRRPGRVAKVHACGFEILVQAGQLLLLRKAKISVYQRGATEAVTSAPEEPPAEADVTVETEAADEETQA